MSTNRFIDIAESMVKLRDTNIVGNLASFDKLTDKVLCLIKEMEKDSESIDKKKMTELLYDINHNTNIISSIKKKET